MSAGENDQQGRNSQLKRRDFLKAISVAPLLGVPTLDSPRGTLVNDVHTGWNPTWVDRVERPMSAADVQVLTSAAQERDFLNLWNGSLH